ncbi:MAG TPA: AAA family ATPase [Vicingus sp.]|nr:AAA family ATPase [Vicingus sp.]
MERLIELFRNKLALVPTQLSRSLMSEIHWDAKLIGIKGARGVGKTTLMLQYIKQQLSNELNVTLYVSLDHLWFTENTLVDLADTFVKRGGKHLFLDEVHKYENWTQELKNIYDAYPTLKVVFTGSSLLEILNARADLSRRAIVYHLQGLSFREYLILHTNNDFKKYSLNTILNHHTEISAEVLQHIKPLVYFDDYLKHGYFPFHLEQPDVYYMRINEIISMMLEIELPLLRGVDVGYVARIKQLLYIISQAVPFVPNVSKLSEKIGIERKTLLTYLHYLDEIALTKNLFKESFGISSLQKPQKIYLENTNYMYALNSESANKGNLRETFFANQLKQNHTITYTDLGDFLVDNKYTFEIGRKSKNNKQIKNTSNSFIAADDIEYGFGNKIPLWMFGFLY